MAYGRQKRLWDTGFFDTNWSGVPYAGRGISANIMPPAAKQSMISGNMSALTGGDKSWLDNLNSKAFWTAMAESGYEGEIMPSAPSAPGGSGRQMGSFEASQFDVGGPKELPSMNTGIMNLPLWRRKRYV